MNAPDIADQPFHLGRLDSSQLGPGARFYNPAVCRNVDGQLIMAYRVQDYTGLSSVRIAFLEDNALQVQGWLDVHIPGVERSTHVEDPRLIKIRGQLLLFVTTVCYGVSYHFRLQGFVLDPVSYQPTSELDLRFGHNGGSKTEKNWMPFEMPHGGLGLVYSVSPFQVIDYDARTITPRKPTDLRKWRFGSINGRTNCVRLGEFLWVTLVGGHVPATKRNSIYWAAAMTFSMDGSGNFEPEAISKEPLMWGSEMTPALLNPYDERWNPICIFPAGLIQYRGGFLTSLGVNDSFCDMLHMTNEQLTDGMVPVNQITGEERCLAVDGLLHPGLIRVRVKSKAPIGEPGGPFFHGDEFNTTPDRVQAIGKLVEVIS